MNKKLKPMAVPNKDLRIVALDEADAKLAKIKKESIDRAERLGLNQNAFDATPYLNKTPQRLVAKGAVYMRKPSRFRVSVGVGMGVAFVLFFVCLAAGVMSRGA